VSILYVEVVQDSREYKRYYYLLLQMFRGFYLQIQLTEFDRAYANEEILLKISQGYNKV